ncbi:hypothetical protein [Butyrivibrio sp. MC2013]|uniref:hypothetical protein n=1 Tax=Butyrivibrio sp. MC2013 TaxID=1280686 RepID=UPI0003FB7883|nr:hypothetical protein [Butyrivibrio sp. MC2013]
MGELISKLGELKVGDEVFDVELNASATTNGEESIHIQNSKYRFECSRSDFLKIAATIIFAEKNFESYKEL